MTFYLTCSQIRHNRSAVMMDVGIVQVMIRSPCPGSFAQTNQAICAILDLSVAFPNSKVYVLNILQYDFDSIAYFFIVLTPCKWIVFTVTQ